MSYSDSQLQAIADRGNGLSDRTHPTAASRFNAGDAVFKVLGATEARELHVPGEMQALSRTLSELHSLVAALSERLQPVVAQTPEPAGALAPEPDPYLVPLANDLRAMRKRLEMDINDLRRLCGGLEL